MAKTLQGMLDEADTIINSRLTVKTAEAGQTTDEIRDLAEQIKISTPVTEYTMTEKVAYARAIMDTILNMDYLVKVAELEDRAEQSGIPGEKVAEFFEKNANRKFKSVLDLMDS